MPVSPLSGLVVCGTSLGLLLAASYHQNFAFARFARRLDLTRSAKRRIHNSDSSEDRTVNTSRSSDLLTQFPSHLSTVFEGEGSPLPSMSSFQAFQRPLRFRVLLLDHDDTTVRGTEEVHYPAHVESVRILRPDLEPVSLHGWFMKNHEPGVSCYLKSLFSAEQMKEEHEIWVRAIEAKMPSFYEGMAETLSEFRSRGGLIAVISHSPTHAIWKHYKEHPLADKICPDLVLGWDNDPQKRKPAAWPAIHALEQLQASASEALVIDDLSPGVKMAKAAGITSAGAGWGHSVPAVEEYMRRECEHYFSSVEEFSNFLLASS